MHFTNLKCLKNYGFCANSAHSIQKNFNVNIQKAPSELYAQPKNLAFHNLCDYNKLPTGTKQLLGLNLKFCIATSKIQNNINKTMLRIARAIRTMYYLKQSGANKNNDYEKQIYIQNKQWHPPPAPLEIEKKMTEFEKILKKKQQELINKLNNTNLNNLTPQQRAALKHLRTNHEIIIKPTNKNLGPAIMDTKTYIHQVLKEHLLTDTYKQLSSKEAKEKNESIKNTLKNIINSNPTKLSPAEVTYFQRSLKGNYRLPIFYGLPKVHKTPMML
jgi:mRNA-degrading endonuclease RelE of RelBE toxin-antitoxin system